MAGADTNRFELSYVEETTWDTTPATPVLTKMRLTGATGLGANPVTVVSEEIRSDRQITDNILVDKEVSGDTAFELSYDTLDDLIPSAMYADWDRQVYRRNDRGDTAEIASIASNIITIKEITARPGADFNPTSTSADVLMYLSGFGTSSNDGLKVVTLATSTSIESFTVLVDEADVPDTASIRLVGVRAVTNADIKLTATTITSEASTINFSSFNISAGDWIRVSGSATAANNTFVRVSDVAENTITLDRVPTGWTADTAGALKITLYLGDKINNATSSDDIVEHSFTLEKHYTDTTDSDGAYVWLSGCVANTFDVTANAASIVNTSISWMGGSGSTGEAAIASSTYRETDATDVMNTSSDVGTMYIGTTPLSKNYLMEASINVNNNLRPKKAVGFLGATSLGVGEFSVTGTLNTYFEDLTLYDLLMGSTAASFNISFTKDSQNIMLDIPRLKFTSGNPEVPGKNQDVMLSLPYQGLRDSTLGYTMKIMSFHYVA